MRLVFIELSCPDWCHFFFLGLVLISIGVNMTFGISRTALASYSTGNHGVGSNGIERFKKTSRLNFRSIDRESRRRRILA